MAVGAQLESVQDPPETREVRRTKKRGPWYQISPLRCGEIAFHLEQFSRLSLSLILLEYHGGLWLFHFIIVVDVFLVSFPGLTCSAPPSPVSRFPLSHGFWGPPSPRPSRQGLQQSQTPA